jgi:hypothetical protein
MPVHTRNAGSGLTSAIEPNGAAEIAILTFDGTGQAARLTHRCDPI